MTHLNEHLTAAASHAPRRLSEKARKLRDRYAFATSAAERHQIPYENVRLAEDIEAA